MSFNSLRKKFNLSITLYYISWHILKHLGRKQLIAYVALESDSDRSIHICLRHTIQLGNNIKLLSLMTTVDRLKNTTKN